MGNPEKTAQKVSLLSYNLYCLPWLACLMKPSTCPLSFERTSAFLKHIPQYDIIGLQEVWSPRYQQVASFAKSQGLHVVGSATASLRSMMGLRVFGGGLMIISKYPIETTRELVFDKGVASDGFVTKGVLYAKVRVGSSYVHVFNTHMQASYGYEFAENDPYSLIRKKQIQQVSNFIAKIALLEDDGYPIIAMGDFNVNAIRRPYETSSPTCELSKLESSREYLDMVQTLAGNGLFEVVDLHREYNGGVHPVTNAGKGVKKGMKESKGGQRLDFMFELRRNITRRDRFFHSFVYCNVIPFEVEGEMYTHISDHFASHAVMEMEHKEWRKERKEKEEEEEEEEEKDGAEREVRRVSNKLTVQLSFE